MYSAKLFFFYKKNSISVFQKKRDLQFIKTFISDLIKICKVTGFTWTDFFSAFHFWQFFYNGKALTLICSNLRFLLCCLSSNLRFLLHCLNSSYRFLVSISVLLLCASVDFNPRFCLTLFFHWLLHTAFTFVVRQ